MHKETSRTSRLWGSVSKTIIAGSLAVALIPAWTGMGAAVANTASVNLPASSAWASTVYTANDTTFVVESPKDETVYAKTDASGKVQGVYVVNRFAAGSGIVMDPASYLSVSNMTTSDVLAQENGKVEVPLQGAEPFYYEGEMAAETALPWNVSLTYYLDGKAIEPTELGGASGKLRIELTVTARTSAPEAGVSDFANSYVLQAQGTFDSSSFEMDENDSVMVAQVGGEAVVNCMVLPGESQTFVLEGTANGFTSSGWQISALPLSLTISIADQDTSQLTSATAQLENATGLLSSGASELESGMGEAVVGASALDEGADKLATGINKLESGVGELTSGVDELENGMQELTSGVGELKTGVDELEAGSEELLSGWQELYDGATALDAGASDLSAGADELVAGVEQLSQGSDAYRAALEEALAKINSGASGYDAAISFYNLALKLYVSSPTESNKALLGSTLDLVIQTSQASGASQALSQALEGYANLEDGIRKLSSGASELDKGSDELAEGAASLYDGAEQFDEYFRLYVSGVTLTAQGIDALSTGVAKAQAGTDKLSEGSDALSSGTKELSDGEGELSDGVDELAEGLERLNTGSKALSEGSSTLAEAVKGMDEQLLADIQKVIDEKLGVDFKLHSFVAPENTSVDSVQFVYMVDGVSADAADEAVDEAPAENTTDDSANNIGFIDRVIAFFKDFLA